MQAILVVLIFSTTATVEVVLDVENESSVGLFEQCLWQVTHSLSLAGSPRAHLRHRVITLSLISSLLPRLSVHVVLNGAWLNL